MIIEMVEDIRAVSHLVDEVAFEKALLEAVDKTFNDLGEPAAKAIYSTLERHFSLKRNEIPERLDDFDASLKALFGEGARFFELQIRKHLRDRLVVKKSEEVEKQGHAQSEPKLAEIRFLPKFAYVLSEIERDPKILSCMDILDQFQDSNLISSEEAQHTRATLFSILDEYARSRFGSVMEEETRKFLANELVYALLLFKVEGEYEILKKIS